MRTSSSAPLTGAMADVYAPIRAGTDVAFLCGIIRHLLEHDLWFR